MLLPVVINTLSTALKLQYVILISAWEIRNKAYSFVPMYMFVIDLWIYDPYLSSHADRIVFSAQNFEPTANGQETLMPPNKQHSTLFIYQTKCIFNILLNSAYKLP